MKTKPTRSLSEPSKTKKLFLPFFLGGIMILSTFAIIFSGPKETSPESYTYHNSYFRLTSQGWESTLQSQPLVLRNGPRSLEPLTLNFSFSNGRSLFTTQKIYLSSLPTDAVQEALRDLYINSNILPPLTLSCSADVEGCEDLPVKTCADATDQIGVLLLQLGEQNSLTVDNHCVLFTASSPSDLTQMIDAFIYTLYGVF